MTFITLGGKNFLRDPSFKNKKAVVYTHNGLLAGHTQDETVPLAATRMRPEGVTDQVERVRWKKPESV